MSTPAPIVHLRPDRMTIWPTEQGTYGLDVRWGGRQGYNQAMLIRDSAKSSGLPVKLVQDVDGKGWTVRVGPLQRDEIARVVETFLV